MLRDIVANTPHPRQIEADPADGLLDTVLENMKIRGGQVGDLLVVFEERRAFQVRVPAVEYYNGDDNFSRFDANCSRWRRLASGAARASIERRCQEDRGRKEEDPFPRAAWERTRHSLHED